jgi:uridine kinase
VTRIVAVEGIDGSGKSRFAAGLADVCRADGVPATVLHIDDFRRELDFTGLDDEAEAALYYESYFDLAALDRELASLQAASTGAGLVIVEGVFTLRVPAVATAGALVLLTVSPDEARRRILRRDHAKGRSDEEINRRIARRYFPARDRYYAELDPEAHADAIVDTEDWRRPRLVRRAPGRFPAPIERLLEGLPR